MQRRTNKNNNFRKAESVFLVQFFAFVLVNSLRNIFFKKSCHSFLCVACTWGNATLDVVKNEEKSKKRVSALQSPTIPSSKINPWNIPLYTSTCLLQIIFQRNNRFDVGRVLVKSWHSAALNEKGLILSVHPINSQNAASKHPLHPLHSLHVCAQACKNPQWNFRFVGSNHLYLSRLREDSSESKKVYFSFPRCQYVTTSVNVTRLSLQERSFSKLQYL